MVGGTQQRFRSTCVSVHITAIKNGVLAHRGQHAVLLFLPCSISDLRVDCAVGQFFAATEEC